MKRGPFGEAREETNSWSMKTVSTECTDGWRVLWAIDTSLAKGRKSDVDERKGKKEEKKKAKGTEERKSQTTERRWLLFYFFRGNFIPGYAFCPRPAPAKPVRNFPPLPPTVREYFARVPKNKLESSRQLDCWIVERVKTRSCDSKVQRREIW